MKVSEQSGIAALRCNQILGLIKKYNIHGIKLIIPLCKLIVRPCLEYCIQTWRSKRWKDIYIYACKNTEKSN